MQKVKKYIFGNIKLNEDNARNKEIEEASIWKKIGLSKHAKKLLSTVLAILVFSLVINPVGTVAGNYNNLALSDDDSGSSTSGEWIRGTDDAIGKDEDGIYPEDGDVDLGDKDALSEFERKHEWTADLVGFVIAIPGKAVTSLLSGKVDLTISGIVMGRVHNGQNSVNWVGFELEKNNPYGILGAQLYYYLRTVSYAVIPFLCLLLLFKKITGDGDAQRKVSVSRMFRDVLLFFGLLIIAPTIVDVVIYIRDCVIFAFKNLFNLGDMDLLGMYADNFNSKGNITNGIMYTAAAIAAFTYLKSYVGIAIKQTLLFGMFPVFGLLGIKDRKMLEKWFTEFMVNLFIPCIDMVLILIPIKITKIAEGMSEYSTGVPTGIKITVILTFGVVVGTRDKIIQLLGAQGGLTQRGGFGQLMMGAMLALRSFGSAIKNNGSSAGSSDAREQTSKEIDALSQSARADLDMSNKHMELARNDFGQSTSLDEAVSRALENDANSDADIKAARMFADGNISEEELKEQGFIPTDEIDSLEAAKEIGAGVIAADVASDIALSDDDSSYVNAPVGSSDYIASEDRIEDSEPIVDSMRPMADIPASYDEFEEARGENLARLSMAESEYMDAEANKEALSTGNIAAYNGAESDILNNASTRYENAIQREELAMDEFESTRNNLMAYKGNHNDETYIGLEEAHNDAKKAFEEAHLETLNSKEALDKAVDDAYKNAKDRSSGAKATYEKYKEECQEKEKAFYEYAKNHDGFSKAQKNQYKNLDDYKRARRKEEIEKKYMSLKDFDSSKAKDVLSHTEKAALYKQRADIAKQSIDELKNKQRFIETKNRQNMVKNAAVGAAKIAAGAALVSAAAGIGVAANATEGSPEQGLATGATIGLLGAKKIGNKIPKATRDPKVLGKKYDDSHMERTTTNLPAYFEGNKARNYKGTYNAAIEREKVPERNHIEQVVKEVAVSKEESSYDVAKKKHKEMTKEARKKFLE